MGWSLAIRKFAKYKPGMFTTLFFSLSKAMRQYFFHYKQPKEKKPWKAREMLYYLFCKGGK